MEGWLLSIELAHWIRLVSFLEAAGHKSPHDEFLADGRELWLEYKDAMHLGIMLDRRTRKSRKRWVKYSRKGRAGLSPEFEPLLEALPPLGPVEVRAWAADGVLPEWVAEVEGMAAQVEDEGVREEQVLERDLKDLSRAIADVGGDRVLECPHCGLVFASADLTSYTAHMERDHPG